jgi:EAL domain-containing protein (putative c-di-GMP-specific phosphodiesterase class I)
MMIGGKRACGKTTELIKVASEKHLYIVCADRNRVHVVSQMAREMKLNIPFPISVEELPLRGYMDEVLVDDVEAVLYQLIRKPVLMASTSMELKKL